MHQFSASVWRAARSNVASRTYKKKAWNELVGPALQRPAKSQKGASKATLRNGETAWCRGFTCTNFRPPFGGLRGQTLRPERTKKRLGMSLSAQHYQDQHRGRKGRQKPPSETAKQHGVAGSRAPIFGLRLEGCEVKRCVQNLQKKAWNELVGPTLPRPAWNRPQLPPLATLPLLTRGRRICGFIFSLWLIGHSVVRCFISCNRCLRWAASDSCCRRG